MGIFSSSARCRPAVDAPSSGFPQLTSTPGFDSSQLLLQLAQAVFGGLARRPARDHAPDKALLLSRLPFQLFESAIELLRHAPQR